MVDLKTVYFWEFLLDEHFSNGRMLSLHQNKLRELKHRFVSINSYSGIHKCPICISDVNRVLCLRTRCGHIFHRNCIKKWMKKSMCCPVCRGNMCECGKCSGLPYKLKDIPASEILELLDMIISREH
jgi:hypothetical protein